MLRSTGVSRTVPAVLALQGGLGNQLYQWAFGTALRAAGVPLAVDVTRCRGHRPLAIEPLIRDWPRVPRVVGLPLAALTRGRSTLRRPVRLVRDDALAGGEYDDALVAAIVSGGSHRPQPPGQARPGLAGPAPWYLLGYFQSPRYFQEVRAQVTEQATAFVRSQLTPEGEQLYREWAGREDSVAIHVRRGDYLTDAAAAATHGVMAPSYYQGARELLDGQGLRRVAWFSDDLPWVEQTLARDGDRLITGEGLCTADGGEIALMSACRVRVLANSSFSWWAGFLGRPSSPERPIIAPAAWYKDGRSTGDRIMPGWSTL